LVPARNKSILLDYYEKNIACFGAKTGKIEKYVVTTIVYVSRNVVRFVFQSIVTGGVAEIEGFLLWVKTEILHDAQ